MLDSINHKSYLSLFQIKNISYQAIPVEPKPGIVTCLQVAGWSIVNLLVYQDDGVIPFQIKSKYNRNSV